MSTDREPADRMPGDGPAVRRQPAPRRRVRSATHEARGGSRSLVVLLVGALLLGGAAEPLSQLLIELVAIVSLVLATIGEDRTTWRHTWPGWLVAMILLAVAVIELVPLPYGLWRALPGHAPFGTLLDALGLDGWRPLSLDPNATITALLATLPGLAAFVTTLRIGNRERETAAWIVVAGALATALLGCLQIVGGSRFYLYADSNVGNLTGLFANHNHAADLLLVGIVLAAAAFGVRDRGRSRLSVLAAGVVILLAVATLLTASRTGALLLAAECVLVPLAIAGRKVRGALKPVALCVPIVLAVGALYLYNPSVGRALDRFHDVEADLRPVLWRTTERAAVDFLPTGSGLGTFVPVYARYEALDTMPSQVVNHAHDEYLELWLELGVFGIAAMLAYAAALIWAATRVWGLAHDRLPALATIAIGVYLASSAVEFPLRNASAMVVFGMLNGIVFAATQQDSRRRSTKLSQGRAVAG